MREILFKGKRKDTGEWVEGCRLASDVILPKGIEFCVDEGFLDGLDGNRAYEVDPETVCQYTGLKDMNGEKIWENDIVKMSIIHYSTRKEIVSATTKVGFVNGQFGVVWGHREEFSSFDGFVKGLTTIEVVGNVFDEVTE